MPKSKHGITLDEYRNTARLYVRRGAAHPYAKLTPERVREIRNGGKTDTQFAHEFGVSRESVRDARIYESWRHVQ